MKRAMRWLRWQQREWATSCRSVTCSSRFGLGWSEGKREKERRKRDAKMRKTGTVDGVFTVSGACTAIRFFWCTLSLSFGC